MNNKEIIALKNSISSGGKYISARTATQLVKQNYKTSNFKDDTTAKEIILSNIHDFENILKEYEFDMYCKYGVFYRCQNAKSEEIIAILKDLNSYIIPESIKFNIPEKKELEDTYNLKFSLYIGNEDEIFKHPVIVTFYKDIDLILLKYNAFDDNDQESNADYYSNLNNEFLSWLKANTNKNIYNVSIIPTFKKILESVMDGVIDNIEPENKLNIKTHSISAAPKNGGLTDLKSTSEVDLPIINELIKLKDDFDSDFDRDKLMDFIKGFLSESEYSKIGLTWSHIFDDSKGKPSKITARAEKRIFWLTEIGSLYEHIHFFADSNPKRNRIDYVVREIAKHL